MRSILVFFLLSGAGMGLYAQWDANPLSMDNPVSITPLHEKNIFSIPDGAGGAILAWEAYDPQSSDLYILVQRKTAQGTVAWGSTSTPITVQMVSESGFLEISDLLPDGSGGAWIAWTDGISDTLSHIYLQRFSSNGTPYFTSPGIRLNPQNGHYYFGARLCATSNGVIAAWSEIVQSVDSVLPSYAQVFAQRFSNSGVPQWATGGIQVCTAPGLRAFALAVSDGSDGALLAFSDARNSGIDLYGEFDNVDIYAQRISASGSRMWGDTGKAVTIHPFNQYTMESWESVCSMVSDGAGGMILVYRDQHNGNESSECYYTQRLNASGTALWTAGGIPLSDEAVNYRENLVVAGNGAQGIVASWKMMDTSYNYALVAQHITGTGTPVWGPSGLQVSNLSPAYGAQSSGMAADGAGYYVMVWTQIDSASYTMVIRAQKFNGAGTAQWTAGGVDICINPVAWPAGAVLVRTAADRLMAAWMDYRNTIGSEANIYAAMLRSDGTLLGTTTSAYYTIGNGTWNDPNTWLGNVVPPPGAKVVIRHAVIGNVNALCSSLQLDPQGSLLVLTGINIRVQL